MNTMKDKIFIRPSIFDSFKEVVCAVSLKYSPDSKPPFYFNQSFSVGDNPENVKMNRKVLFGELKINPDRVTYQRQIHSANIHYSEVPYFFRDSDALYTDKKNIYLGISIADCVPIFIYSPFVKAVAAVHSGWKGTRSRILTKTINTLRERYHLHPEDLFAYIGPAISAEHYEVGKFVYDQFPAESGIERDGKFFIDLAKDNYNQLLNAGMPERNIERSEFCTYRDAELFHSYRRDGDNSGRMLGIIGLKPDSF